MLRQHFVVEPTELNLVVINLGFVTSVHISSINLKNLEVALKIRVTKVFLSILK